MQMRVERLRETMKLLKPAVPGKTTIPVLKNIMLRDGKAVANDLETFVALDLPEVEGGCLVPHREVFEVLKHVPGDEMLSIETKGKALRLTWRDGKASYDVAEVEDYPPVPEVKAIAEGAVDGDILVKALTSVLDYRCTDDTRPVLSGVTLILGETTEVFAADGFRIACQTLPISFPVEETVIIPANTVKLLGHFWGKKPAAVSCGDSLIDRLIGKREIELALGDGVLSACFGQVTIISKLIPGTPPNYHHLIPENPPLKVRVFAGEFDRAALRLAMVAKDSAGIVRLTWDDSTMTLSAKSEDKGKVEADIPVKAEGGPGRTALNISYLLDYLKGKEGLVSMELTNETSPVLFRHDRAPLVLIMPMQVQW
jgi:DNA polymerase-3 subunit beta